MEEKRSIRDSRLDWIRSIALLMIITVHTWSLGRVQSYPLISGIYHAFSDCGVPLFVMVSGALILNRPIDSLRTFYSRRLIRILIPFFLWSALVYCLSAWLGKYEDVHSLTEALRAYPSRLMENRINEAYWFVQMILLLYILTPMLRGTLKRVNIRMVGWILVAWWGAVELCSLFPDWYWVHNFTSLTLRFVGYYVLGYYLYNTTGQWKWNKHLLLIPMLIGFVGCTLVNTPAIIGCRIMLVASLFAWLCLCATRSCRIVRYCSNYSYTIYLIHMVMIPPIYTLLHYDSDATVLQSALVPIATSFAVTVIGMMVCYVLEKVLRGKARWFGITTTYGVTLSNTKS